mmetsp:Transcript_32481/g.67846  ORF Transcript_32481/g.67846 Transcript_32481/m.67846 type:complete len:129 (-) Transcript_32481:265-651(-)
MMALITLCSIIVSSCCYFLDEISDWLKNSAFFTAFMASVLTIDEWVEGTNTPRIVRVFGVILFACVGFLGPVVLVGNDTAYMGKLKGFFWDAASFVKSLLVQTSAQTTNPDESETGSYQADTLILKKQ